MVGIGCNGKQKQGELIDQMSGDTVIIRNPVHNWEVAVLLQDQLQISRVCNTGKKKLAKKP